MPKENLNREIIDKLDELSKKVDVLVNVVALSSKIDSILKGKTKSRQIEILSQFGISKDAIALIVNTTPETVAVRISEKKAKSKKKSGNNG